MSADKEHLVEIEASLHNYIVTQVTKRPNQKLGYNDPLLSTGVIDSFHLVDLAVYVEEKYGVRIEDVELNANTFDTITQLADLIRARLQG